MGETGNRASRNNHWRAGCAERRKSGSEGGRRKSAPVTGVTRRRPTLLNEYIGKGDRIYVAGRLAQNTWEGDDGQRRYRTEIHAQEVVFLDSRGGNGGKDNGDASDIEEPVAASPF